MIMMMLSACGGQEVTAEELAYQIREEYAALAGWQGTMEVTADYGSSVYDFTLDVVWQKEGETTLTVTAPELVAGITARIGPDGGYLEYDGASLGIGTVAGDGLSPLELVPYMMKELLEGYLDTCSFRQEGEKELLQIACKDPRMAEEVGTACILYVERDSHHLHRVELEAGGTVVVTGRMTSFTKEAMNHDNGAGQSMG